MGKKNMAVPFLGGLLTATLIGTGIGVANSSSGNSSGSINSRSEALAALGRAHDQVESAHDEIEAVRKYLNSTGGTGGTAPPTTSPSKPPTTSPTKPPTTSPTVPPTTTIPSGTGIVAAEKFGWGTPVVRDEFNTGSTPGALWSMYNSEGHDGNGLRRPSAFSVFGGILTVTGSRDGVSGGMAMRHEQKYGKWEARMRVTPGDRDYHPVLLLWPTDNKSWPAGGEVDYAEMESTAKEVDFFLHYGEDNSQTHASKAVDISQWHHYAVERTPDYIRGYIDGVQFFEDRNKGHLPPASMHATIQLDAFGGDSGYTETKMHVDWIRVYK